MSVRLTPVRICDGCGTVIDFDYYISLKPDEQAIPQPDHAHSGERDFCCEACMRWWQAEYPNSGHWGPAWDDRHWWRTVLANEYKPVRTAHEATPLIENHSHFEDPEIID